MRRVYEELQLGDFEAVRPAIEKYFAGQKDYKTNRYEMTPELHAEITRRWAAFIEQYGYAKEAVGSGQSAVAGGQSAVGSGKVDEPAVAARCRRRGRMNARGIRHSFIPAELRGAYPARRCSFRGRREVSALREEPRRFAGTWNG